MISINPCSFYTQDLGNADISKLLDDDGIEISDCGSDESDNPMRIDSDSEDALISDDDDEMSFDSVDELDSEDGWTNNDEDTQDIPFTKQALLNLPVFNGEPTALDFLNIFLGELYTVIANETNIYATATINKAPRPLTERSRLNLWKPTNEDDIQKFIGVCILMGLWELPNLRNYWNTSGIYENNVFRNFMKRDRFENILRMLHFSTLDSATTGDPLAKIRNVLEHLRLKFQETYYPEKELTLDEMILPFKERINFRSYMDGKRHKYGFKVHKVCSSEGYVLNFEICAGNTGTEKIETLVLDLLEPYLHVGHEIYMDDYYNSVSLCQKLVKANTHAIGPLRKIRKYTPKSVVVGKLKNGERIWKRKGTVLVQKWKDKKEILMISTKHKSEMVETTNKRKQHKLKPTCVVDYNKFMDGVDFSDQRSYQPSPRRTVKWYKKLFFFFLDIAIVNAHIIAKKNCQFFRTKTMVEFKEEIVKNILPTLGIKKEHKNPSRIKHFLVSIPSTSKKHSYKRCVQCSTALKIRKETRYQCEGCDGKPALCVEPCFKLWHEA